MTESFRAPLAPLASVPRRTTEGFGPCAVPRGYSLRREGGGPARRRPLPRADARRRRAAERRSSAVERQSGNPTAATPRHPPPTRPWLRATRPWLMFPSNARWVDFADLASLRQPVWLARTPLPGSAVLETRTALPAIRRGHTDRTTAYGRRATPDQARYRDGTLARSSRPTSYSAVLRRHYHRVHSRHRPGARGKHRVAQSRSPSRHRCGVGRTKFA